MSISLTVVICHYEQYSDLQRCVKSILCQTDLPERIIIVDDGSKVPPSLGELSSHQETCIEIYQIACNSGGPARPRNTAASLCESSHIAFLDADDQWLPTTVKSLKSVWEKSPRAIAYGDIICWRESGRRVYYQPSGGGRKPGSKHREITYQQLLNSGNTLFLSTIGGPARVFQDNLFDEQQQWEDYDLWLRLCQQGQIFRYTGEIHTLYQVKQGSRSGSRKARHAGCKGIMEAHLRYMPIRNWPLWYWKQRWL